MNILLGILGTFGTKLLTEKVIIKLFLIVAEYLVKSSKNKLDDEAFKTIKEALDK